MTALPIADTGWHQITTTFTATVSENPIQYSVYGTALPSGATFDADDFSLTTPS